MYSTRYSSQILMEVEFSQQRFEEHSDTKFKENLIVPCRPTDGRTEGQTDRQTDGWPDRQC
jgi:hypothetical protein